MTNSNLDRIRVIETLIEKRDYHSGGGREEIDHINHDLLVYELNDDHIDWLLQQAKIAEAMNLVILEEVDSNELEIITLDAVKQKYIALLSQPTEADLISVESMTKNEVSSAIEIFGFIIR